MTLQQTIIPAIIIIFLISCYGNSEKLQPEINSENETEFIMDSTITETKFTEPISTKDSTSILEGKAFYNSSYCNGAPPPADILEDLKKFRILINSEIKFVNHSDETIIAIAKTDENGNYQVNLENGKWDYYLTPNISKKYGIDPNCTERFENKYGTIEINETSEKIPDLHFHFDCDPCDPTIKMRP